jgi:N-acetylneuraminic acid mutarotase
VYDPVLNTWTALAAMPDMGRNHAAAGTDGAKLFVFGGRRAGNWVTNGYNSLMIYDPGTNTWSWSGDGVSGLAPLPEARGGMGKAVYFRGEFYVFGGETLDDPDANASGVYDRVDVYRPSTNAWRQEAPMPFPRHGIFPVLFQGHMFLAGGGAMSGNSQSAVFDEFTRQ